jgi:hypothetical protein
VRKARKEDRNPKSCDEVFAALAADVGPEELYNEVIHQVGDAGDAGVSYRGCGVTGVMAGQATIPVGCWRT